jgi:hypothetical protein
MSITTRSAAAALLSLSLALAGAAPAAARPFDINANGSIVPAGSTSVAGQPSAATGVYGTAPTIVRVTTPASGFDWGDAGIGAAGGLALSVTAAGAGLVVSQRRSRRTRPSFDPATR